MTGPHPPGGPAAPDQKNLILAVVVSILVLIGFHYFYEAPRIERLRQQQASAQARQQNDPAIAAIVPAGPRPLAEVLAETPRVPISGPRLTGSLPTTGIRLDDLTLTDYYNTVAGKKARDPDDHVVLLAPEGSRGTHSGPYYAQFGWLGEAGIALPGPETQWSTEATGLAPGQPVTLTWDNGQGLVFQRRIEIDADYLFTITDSVRNEGAAEVRLTPFAQVTRQGHPPLSGVWILHEGLLGMLGGSLREVTYSSLTPGVPMRQPSTGGWLGITDKYWLVGIIPDQTAQIRARFALDRVDRTDFYTADMAGEPVTVPVGGTAETRLNLFAGAKEVGLLDRYGEALAVPSLDLAVDFGWFYFITKPFFYGLDWLGWLLGNFGVAILVFTVFLRVLMFPLADKSYKEMSRMKLLQPKMMELKERYGSDQQALQREMLELYKREKVNPMAGCLPILLQIPIFFALYKVLFVTIEMRHAPFFGWIDDLSAPDPTSIFNLFGLIPWDPPSFLLVGIWPILMGVTMWLQMKLNPAPQDPIQAQVLQLMPIMFTFMLAAFPAGLVIYWTWTNILSIGQQWLIMRRMGVKVT